MLRLAVAQFNATVGDLTGNVERIIQCAAEARSRGAHVLLTPELALSGYPPEDLLLRPDFYRACHRALDDLACRVDGIAIVVGHPEEHDGACYNAATVIEKGRCIATYRKMRLPNYDVFDEKRYFEQGTEPCVVTLNGVRCGINICADIWEEGAAELSRQAGAELLLVLNASPCHLDKTRERVQVLADRVEATGMPAIYCNLVGGQDELIFDGDSFVMDAAGTICAQLRHFEEDLQIVAFDGATPVPQPLATPLTTEAQVYQALVLGVRDYIVKNGFPGVLIGMSGGVDSALTLAIAVDALGADKVRAVMMPSQFTADISWIDSRDMVKRLNVRYDEIPIKQTFDAFRATLATEFAGLAEDATEENIQARIRGTLLMALSNKHGSIVLTTGNKSEMAVGYCTLYGDMAGGFAVIKDIAKTLVYRLCAWRNSVSDVIPERILTRGPSAELRADQLDQDSLPPYDVLDGIMQLYMEENRPIAEIIEAGYPPADVARVTRLIKINEYKRRQSPVGIRVTHRGFGRDWRYPITSKFYE